MRNILLFLTFRTDIHLITCCGDLLRLYLRSVPPFFALVTRGLGLLEGIALVGDPTFDIFQASYPFAKRKAMESFTVTDYGKISLNLLSLRRTSTQMNG